MPLEKLSDQRVSALVSGDPDPDPRDQDCRVLQLEPLRWPAQGHLQSHATNGEATTKDRSMRASILPGWTAAGGR